MFVEMHVATNKLACGFIFDIVRKQYRNNCSNLEYKWASTLLFSTIHAFRF